jgi:hypothetical protein
MKQLLLLASYGVRSSKDLTPVDQKRRKTVRKSSSERWTFGVDIGIGSYRKLATARMLEKRKSCQNR